MIEDLFHFTKKKNILDKHKNEEMIISKKIEVLKDKNSLIKDKIDLDFIEILLRDKFMFGKNGDKIYMIKKYEN